MGHWSLARGKDWTLAHYPISLRLVKWKAIRWWIIEKIFEHLPFKDPLRLTEINKSMMNKNLGTHSVVVLKLILLNGNGGLLLLLLLLLLVACWVFVCLLYPTPFNNGKPVINGWFPLVACASGLATPTYTRKREFFSPNTIYCESFFRENFFLREIFFFSTVSIITSIVNYLISHSAVDSSAPNILRTWVQIKARQLCFLKLYLI